MVAKKEQKMGRFAVEVELANFKDVARAEDGLISPEQVRKARIRGVVDSGATYLVIPESVAKQLGAETRGRVKVRYADGRTADRPVAKHVHLSYGGRDSVFDAIVEPGRESALIGAIVLEVLDYRVDCTEQRLVPRDPKQITAEVE